MFSRASRLGLLAAIALTLSITGCAGGAGESTITSAASASSGATTAPADDGSLAFVEAVRDRVPMINSKTDKEIVRIGKDLCTDPKDLGMTAANADKLHLSSLVLADNAKNETEASVILGLARQHMCRPV